MRRGDIVIGAEQGAFTGKPRPFVIVQANRMLDASATVTVCPLTTSLIGIGRIRIAVPADSRTGLEMPSEIEVDRIVTVRRSRLRQRIGEVPVEAMKAVDAALCRWLDL